jgi:hypothetical protein
MSRPESLLCQLAPALRFDAEERFFADPPTVLVHNDYRDGPSRDYATRLLRGDGAEIARVGHPDPDRRLTLDYLRPDEYPCGERTDDGDYLDPGFEWVADARRARGVPAEDANRVYGWIAESESGGHWLQYWFFYFASVKGLPGVRAASGILGQFLHAGDWEMVQFHVPAGAQTPDRATYAAHDYAFKVEDPTQVIDDGRPVVYVALDSHASYPLAGRWRNLGSGWPLQLFKKLDDRCDANGDRPETKFEAITSADHPWAWWPGSWGRPGPRSPACQRPWRDPDEFHREAHDVPDGWRGHELEEEGIVTPEDLPVTVEHSNGVVNVSFRVPDELEDGWAGILTLAFDPPGMALPDLREYDVTEPGTKPPLSAQG